MQPAVILEIRIISAGRAMLEGPWFRNMFDVLGVKRLFL